MMITFVCLALLGSTNAAAAPARGARPNIVFLLADDLGFGDLGCQGHPHARTPHLDRLAAEGTRFTRFVVCGVTCCPSRTAFMTGRFPARFAKYPASNGFGDAPTITSLLHAAGYRTGHFGKWHIGPTQASGTYGIETINANDERRPRKRTDGRGRDASIIDQVIAFIEKHRDAPFLVNAWCHSTHFPVDPPEKLVAALGEMTLDENAYSPFQREKFATVRQRGGDPKDGLRRYLADVHGLDASIGRLLRRLDELGLRENTIVVFSSDHGPGGPELPSKAGALANEKKAARLALQNNAMGYAGPFRGGKHGMHEGGVRVPFIVRWPGRVKANAVDDRSLLAAVDWLPTLAALTGVGVAGLKLDGVDASAAWLGRPFVRSKPIFWKTNNTRSEIAARDGDWKLIHPNGKRGRFELYNVADDPGETQELAARQPEVARRLTSLVEAWNATLPTAYEKADDND